MAHHSAPTDMSAPFDKNHPFLAKLVDRRRLSSPASQKDTQHFSVSLSGSGLTYKCGDSLGVYPVNNPKAVDALLTAAGFSGNESITIPKDTSSMSLREALSKRLSLNAPTYKFVQCLHDRATDAGQKSDLASKLVEADAEKKKSWIEQREFVDLFTEYPSAKISAQELVVRYETNGRAREGVCSTYLADRARM
ncbi:MAG: sulfite reductase subunit alpha, partial [Verrucomicrobia bacterium]|nr:sulfite reductase subunit alpha [Verrucomicrobiota bacterium]